MIILKLLFLGVLVTLAVIGARSLLKLPAPVPKKGGCKGKCGGCKAKGQTTTEPAAPAVPALPDKRQLPVGKPGPFVYCPWCSGELAMAQVDGKNRLKCGNCPYVNWDNPLPVVVVLIPHADGGIVLVKRNVQPRLGFWGLPAGFVDGFESPSQAAKREAKEETGLDVNIVGWLGDFAPPGRNQFLSFFLAETVAGAIPGPVLKDVSEARAFKPDELPAELAFPSHKDVIDKYLNGTL